MSNTKATTPTRSTEPTAPEYEVPDSLEAWERFDMLVGKVLKAPKDVLETNVGEQAASPKKKQKVASIK